MLNANGAVDPPRGTGQEKPSGPLALGFDIGSTTVKTVAFDASSRRVLWSRYDRHESHQAARVLEHVKALERHFSTDALAAALVFATGSGATPLVEPLGARFVQEVNASIAAIEALHPDVGSLIELGGQDAKIVIFKDSERAGERRTIASMNDKCASGTGATIDKCLAKLGVNPDLLATILWDPSKLHSVAAKCGVFAETDIVNLLKAGLPTIEIVCSLANAIVQQNLSVLTRGHTLRWRVALLGGPNVYLPFLRDCWRQRIAETWRERGQEIPPGETLESLIFVPDHAQYYPAIGAAISGLADLKDAPRAMNIDALEEFVRRGRRDGLAAKAGPPLVKDDHERDEFVARYAIPKFEPAKFKRGATVAGYVGLDGGSTSSKAVLIDAAGRVLSKQYIISGGNPLADMKALLARIAASVYDQGAKLDVLGFGVTGYAADVVNDSVEADAAIVETIAHMNAATLFFGDVDVICDVGGQDIKVLFMANGIVKDFRLSNQCSAGNGALLQAMGDQFGVSMQDYADAAFDASISPNFSYGCAVFLDADRVTFQKEGFTREEILAGLARVLPQNIWQYIVQVPRMAALGTRFVLQGGTQYNLAALKAQVDYIKQRVPNAEIFVHPHCGEAGAIGAALEARRVVTGTSASRFVGMEAAIGIAFTTRNDESTICRFCTSECRRTFIDTKTKDGRTSRYIVGFSCENGTVESKDELKAIAARRKALRRHFPNLVEIEARLAFEFSSPGSLPKSRAKKTPGWFDKLRPARIDAGLAPSEDRLARRKSLRVGIPRVLNLYSTGPLWRAYFETLGLRPEDVVFSDQTSEELCQEGSRFASVDPCFPAKVAVAHVHNLLTRKSEKAKLDFIFFPALSHVPGFADNVMGSTSCTVVSGTPAVVRAAFTKETDRFVEAGLDYVSPVLNPLERDYFAHQMFLAWGERLSVTREENRFACEAGFEALRRFDQEMQNRGRGIIERLEREGDIGILLLGRPYHNDPGVNHDVLEEFQALGHPILSIRSIPKDPAWLRRYFERDLASGRIRSPLDITDVWPECYSTNSTEKVWAAKFAARHRNIALLDLSSFKCGHDAPTYGLIDKIIGAAQTPYLALHDIDANNPRGSIAIRVKTFAHVLKLHAERRKAEAGSDGAAPALGETPSQCAINANALADAIS